MKNRKISSAFSVVVGMVVSSSAMGQDAKQLPDAKQFPAEYVRAFVQNCLDDEKKTGSGKSKGYSPAQIGAECGCAAGVSLASTAFEKYTAGKASAIVGIQTTITCVSALGAKDGPKLKE